MQVLCRSTKGNAETRCCICGQGFVMFWERQSRTERFELMKEIQQALRHQHRVHKGPDAHPHSSFLVPELTGANLGPVAVSQGGVPSWAL